ncbi:MAG TPA: hypothetical protein ENH62_01615 [Marinobacter sp.]|nr:hypothetical protein [Marinobacter sp.]
MSEVSKVGSAPAGRHNCTGLPAPAGWHNHEMGPIDSRYEAWIRRGGYRFGKDPCGYDVLFEETRALTEDIEIEIRVIRWKIPKDTG